MLVPGFHPVKDVVVALVSPAAQDAVPVLLIPELFRLLRVSLLRVPEWIAECFNADAHAQGSRARRWPLVGPTGPGQDDRAPKGEQYEESGLTLPFFGHERLLCRTIFCKQHGASYRTTHVAQSAATTTEGQFTLPRLVHRPSLDFPVHGSGCGPRATSQTYQPTKQPTTAPAASPTVQRGSRNVTGSNNTPATDSAPLSSPATAIPAAPAITPARPGRSVNAPTAAPRGTDTAANTQGGMTPKPPSATNGRHAAKCTQEYRLSCRKSSGDAP